ncbi:MAG: prephenate dehydratase [Verrucomicrobiae bacterium]|nr:prephenate dehydratase [Verrucomicrobiae bacterium]
MIRKVAYLGPEGTFASIVARKRYKKDAVYIPQPTVRRVVDYVCAHKASVGIVPVENSSGGIILDLVDSLNEAPQGLWVQAELAINVRLALLGHRGRKIETVYSHFAPLQHCDDWLLRKYPKVRRVRTETTGEAATKAAADPHAAAIATKKSARQYGLDVLTYPIKKETPNITQFFALGWAKPKGPAQETSLLVSLKNESGSLLKFLKPFADEGLNLKRIVSRNILGQPNTYIFFVGVEAAQSHPGMRRALAAAKKSAARFRVLGSYAVEKAYES